MQYVKSWGGGGDTICITLAREPLLPLVLGGVSMAEEAGLNVEDLVEAVHSIETAEPQVPGHKLGLPLKAGKESALQV